MVMCDGDSPAFKLEYSAKNTATHIPTMHEQAPSLNKLEFRVGCGGLVEPGVSREGADLRMLRSSRIVRLFVLERPWLDACERSVFERSGRRIILDRSPRPASPATPAHTRWPVSGVWAIFTPIICEQAAVSLMSPHSGLLSIV